MWRSKHSEKLVLEFHYFAIGVLHLKYLDLRLKDKTYLKKTVSPSPSYGPPGEYLFSTFLQIEQEMGLINGRIDTKDNFLKNWASQYVPAILSYGQNSSKRNIFNHFNDMNVSGMVYLNLMIPNFSN